MRVPPEVKSSLTCKLVRADRNVESMMNESLRRCYPNLGPTFAVYDVVLVGTAGAPKYDKHCVGIMELVIDERSGAIVDGATCLVILSSVTPVEFFDVVARSSIDADVKKKIASLKPAAFFVCKTDLVSRYLFPQTETDQKSLDHLGASRKREHQKSAEATLIRILEFSVLENAS